MNYLCELKTFQTLQPNQKSSDLYIGALYSGTSSLVKHQ